MIDEQKVLKIAEKLLSADDYNLLKELLFLLAALSGQKIKSGQKRRKKIE